MSYTFVGQNDGTGTSTAVTTFSINYTPTQGNLLVFAVYSHSSNVITLSDNNAVHNTYTAIANAGNSTDNYFLYSFFAPNCSGGATTFTATYNSSTTFPSLYVGEYSGVANIANPLVGSGSAYVLAPGTNTNAIASSAATPTAVPSLLWSFCGSGNVTAPANAGTGFTGQASVFNSGARAEDQIVLTASSLTSTFTAATGNGGRDYAVLMGQFVLTPTMLGQACL